MTELYGKLLKELAPQSLILPKLLYGETTHQLCSLTWLGLKLKENQQLIWLENNGTKEHLFQECKKEELKLLKQEDFQVLQVQETQLLNTWEVGS